MSRRAASKVAPQQVTAPVPVHGAGSADRIGALLRTLAVAEGV